MLLGTDVFYPFCLTRIKCKASFRMIFGPFIHEWPFSGITECGLTVLALVLLMDQLTIVFGETTLSESRLFCIMNTKIVRYVGRSLPVDIDLLSDRHSNTTFSESESHQIP